MEKETVKYKKADCEEKHTNFLLPYKKSGTNNGQGYDKRGSVINHIYLFTVLIDYGLPGKKEFQRLKLPQYHQYASCSPQDTVNQNQFAQCM
ncbi:MAG: hypothetical protein JXA42_23540 [Anaerolineales bacterium]|nr:hypothetical protein [Anaerolineales bacterium]